MENLEGLQGAKVVTQDTVRSSQYEQELTRSLEFLDKYNNPELSELLKGLPDAVRLSIFQDLGGSFADILAEESDMTKAKIALAEYEANMLTDVDKGSSVKTTEEKHEKRRLALKMLKASVIS